MQEHLVFLNILLKSNGLHYILKPLVLLVEFRQEDVVAFQVLILLVYL